MKERGVLKIDFFILKFKFLLTANSESLIDFMDSSTKISLMSSKLTSVVSLDVIFFCSVLASLIKSFVVLISSNSE